MDEPFQFIIESPQNNTGHKKRPRLVTSCDNCRLKKIKCLQHTPETRCEACKVAKIQCRFRDRERYFAERSRAIAGPNVASSYAEDRSPSSSSTTSHSNSRSTSHSPKASGLVAAEGVDLSGRYAPYPTDPRRIATVVHKSSNSLSYQQPRNGNMGYNFVDPVSQPISHSHSRQPSQPPNTRIDLFDPKNIHYPHPEFMHQFFQAFLQHLRGEYNFVNIHEVMDQYYTQHNLSASLANCIAAIAARFCNTPELALRGLHNISETYTSNAKNLLNATHIPSFDNLHALMLLAWIEYKMNRIPEFRRYCQMTMTMAMELGLNDQYIQMQPLGTPERTRLQDTWDNILQLHLRSSSCR